MSITYIKADGSDIKRLVDKIENVIDGEHITHVSIACLVVAILAQRPDIDPDEMQETVKGVSEYMAACLSPNEVTH